MSTEMLRGKTDFVHGSHALRRAAFQWTLYFMVTPKLSLNSGCKHEGSKLNLIEHFLISSDCKWWVVGTKLVYLVNKTFSSYRGLFEKDKLVFSFMLCGDIMKQAGIIGSDEWNFFLRGAAGMDKVG